MTQTYDPVVQGSEHDSLVWRQRTFRQKWLGGRRFALRLFLGTATLILIINIVVSVWASRRFGLRDGYGTIHEGNCSFIEVLNNLLHLIINITSTLLLLGSNAFLQAVAAPTRQDIDNAHSMQKSLRIGILSFRNFSRLTKTNVFLAVLLLLSSIPFHLLYNSVVFSSLSANDYYVAVTTEGFLRGDAFNLSNALYNRGIGFGSGPEDSYGTPDISIWVPAFEKIRASASSYKRLDNKACIKAYSKQLVSSRRNVVVISSDRNNTNSVLVYGDARVDNEGASDQTNWICSNDAGIESIVCDATPYLNSPATWSVYGHPVEYCLSETTSEYCSVKFSTTIGIIILVCNLLKVCTEYYILFRGDIDNRIASVGDAIASYLSTSDSYTGNAYSVTHPITWFWIISGRAQFTSRPKSRHGSAVSKVRWTMSVLSLLVAVTFVLILFGLAFSTAKSKGFDTSASGFWRLGFGNINPELLVASENFGTPDSLAVLANLPQLILAFISLLLTGIFASIFSSREYGSLAKKPNYLMVSNPVGKQRGTWLLGLPLVWGISVCGLQVLLHWLVGRSLFLVQVTAFDVNGMPATKDDYESVSNLGYSLLPMILAVVTAIVWLVVVIIVGLQKKASSIVIPQIGSESAAIAASCHAQHVSEAAQYLKVGWFSTGYGNDGAAHSFITNVAKEIPLE